MKHVPPRQARCLALTLFSSISLLDAPHARSQPGAPMMDVTVSLKVGSDAFTSRAPGRCTYAPTASIYGVLSEMWTVRQEVQGRYVHLTLWRSKKDAQDTFSLWVNDRKNLTVSTVRGQVSGSGTVKLQTSGIGGAFAVDAKAETGEAITGTIRCAAFSPAVAEGG
jgi:HrpA-like RNA helicase